MSRDYLFVNNETVDISFW